MSISSCDIGNPIYNKQQPEPTFERDEFDDTLIDGLEKEHDAHIKWEGYFYDGRLRIVKLEVRTKYDDYYFEEVVTECISLRENKRVVVECQIEII